MNLKKKLAIFDFDNTIKQHAPGFSTGGGMAEFFPDKKIPVEFPPFNFDHLLVPF